MWPWKKLTSRFHVRLKIDPGNESIFCQNVYNVDQWIMRIWRKFLDHGEWSKIGPIRSICVKHNLTEIRFRFLYLNNYRRYSLESYRNSTNCLLDYDM